MYVEFEREYIEPPPISEVVIRLTPEEASYLRRVFGNFSHNGMARHLNLDPSDEAVDRIHGLTSDIYDRFFDEVGDEYLGY